MNSGYSNGIGKIDTSSLPFTEALIYLLKSKSRTKKDFRNTFMSSVAQFCGSSISSEEKHDVGNKLLDHCLREFPIGYGVELVLNLPMK